MTPKYEKHIHKLSFELKVWKEKFATLAKEKKKNESDLTKQITTLTKQLKREYFEENLETSSLGENIKNYLEAETGYTLSAICRDRDLVDTRFMFYRLMRKYTKESLKLIGTYVGSVDHSTVLNGLNVAQDLIDTSKDFAKTYDRHDQYVKENFFKKEQLIEVIKPQLKKITLEIEFKDHDKVVLINNNGDTYTSKSEELMEFLTVIEPIVAELKIAE